LGIWGAVDIDPVGPAQPKSKELKPISGSIRGPRLAKFTL